jgi:hypothetical protein
MYVNFLFCNEKPSMEPKSSYHANGSCVDQGISRPFWNSKFSYHVHNSRPWESVFSQMNPVHSLISYFIILDFHVNIPCVPRPPKSIFLNKILYSFLISPCILPQHRRKLRNSGNLNRILRKSLERRRPVVFKFMIFERADFNELIQDNVPRGRGN